MTARECFTEVLKDLGFGNKKPSELSNSDYWMCTTEAMKRFAYFHSSSALSAASEKAVHFVKCDYCGFEKDILDEEIIFNSYPLELIK